MCPKNADIVLKEKFLNGIAVVFTQKFYRCFAYKILLLIFKIKHINQNQT